jgi:hypothetical protein
MPHVRGFRSRSAAYIALGGSKKPSLIMTHTAAFLALLVVSVIAGGAYLSLGFKARAHLTTEASETDRSRGWLFWWSLNKRVYDLEGQQLCRKGNLLAVVLAGLYIAWYVLLLK